jgi:hypothetical protein
MAFIEEYGTSDMFENEKETNPKKIYNSLVKNTMARYYTYLNSSLFCKGKVETFNMIVDLQGLGYSECKSVSYFILNLANILN